MTRSFTFKNGICRIKTPDCGIASHALKFGLPVKNGGLDMSNATDEKYDEIRDVLLQAGYTFN